MKRSAARGFTLLEVIIALAILSISLVVLLQSQSAALDSAGRSRDMTVAALLLRSKMIDIEKRLFHDGFTLNTEEDDGDFADEDHPEIRWQSRISEVQLDITALTSICGSLPSAAGGKKDADEDHTAQNDCESQLTGLGQTLAPYTEELGRSMRAVELMVTWPAGRYEESMSIRTLLTRDDFGTEQESDATRQQSELNRMQGGASGAAMTGGAPASGQVQ
jgi:general secretion pathway protein I